MDGWISIYRKIRENFVWKSKEPFDKRSAWIDILLSANHTMTEILFGNEKLVVKPGEFITSLRKLSENWKWSITKVDNFLNVLNKEHMITIKKDTKKTIISVANWGFYQSGLYEKITQEEQKERNEKDTKKNQKETNNNDNNIFNNIIYSDEEKKLNDEWLKNTLERSDKLFKKLGGNKNDNN